MLKSVLGSLAQLVAKPQVLVAGILAGIFQLVLALVAWDSGLDLFEQVIVLGQMPDVGILELPFAFFQLYFPQLSVLFLVLLVGLIVQFWASIVLGRFAKNSIEGKGGIGEALGFGVSHLGKICWAIIFLMAVSAVFFAAFGIVAGIAGFSIELSIILALVLMIVLAYLYVRLVFFLPIMGAKDANARDALLESWEFSKKKFWTIVIFLVIVSLVAGVFDLAGTILSEQFTGDVVSGIIVAIFAILSSTYSGLALANYYVMKDSGSPKMYYEPRHASRKRRKL